MVPVNGVTVFTGLTTAVIVKLSIYRTLAAQVEGIGAG
jgi:hypothetical protein